MNGRVIISAIAVRPYVQAAASAGFEVLAIDLYADEETRLAAAETYIIRANDNGLDARELLELLELIVKPDDVFCYGAGFERQPLLLKKIAKLLPVMGNTPLALNHANTPKFFFAMLDNLALSYPAFSFDGLKKPRDWIQKKAGGSGGCHITRALPLQDIPPKVDHYYQQEIMGAAISLLFLADGKHIEVVGFNGQWCAPTALYPYRYGGAVSHINLSDNIKNQIQNAAADIAKELKLIGINSLDCIVDHDVARVLELNPRLSATFALYENAFGDLFKAHLAACSGDEVKIPRLSPKSHACQIIYANKGCIVPVNMGWPDFVLDRPVAGSIIEEGQPLCSVFARAEYADDARKLVAEYAESL